MPKLYMVRMMYTPNHSLAIRHNVCLVSRQELADSQYDRHMFRVYR